MWRMVLINGMFAGVTLAIALIILYETRCWPYWPCSKPVCGEVAGDVCSFDSAYQEYALSDAVHGRLPELRLQEHHSKWPSSIATRYVRNASLRHVRARMCTCARGRLSARCVGARPYAVQEREGRGGCSECESTCAPSGRCVHAETELSCASDASASSPALVHAVTSQPPMSI